ncbi:MULTISPECIES: elongation factor P 5-aminopentanone reductase [Eisenbergiella]|uniref:SDR family NAD(P)-dependent oxidoreductase n=1 Tax=Eisenbergiella porci TaxID=2652274 RepID=A0A6N7WNF6_9FIRM|nr:MULTISPECIES: SDR family NAD(P)-dependent oxidoreductase [Eisenbergiella]MDY2655255.1 SDR family NAD(P)-dependent oxidoreductase [Eisenbergiella porci]MSS90988.1 SDR family NAD(P)-dependent oxidoreductase [Eisenbergiella porci]
MRKKALITGASRGIGEAIAKELARQGFDLTLTCLNSLDQLKELAGGLEKKYGVSCHIFQGDMGDPEAVDRLFDGMNRLDVLINNAGISHIGLLSDMSVSQWRRVMSTNLDSCFYTCRRAIPLMVHAKQGRIINISSVWGQAGASMEAAYSASKGGVNSLTKALAKELAPSNIQVNAIACGVIDTDMNRCFSPEEMASLIEEIPADRIGRPEEVAALAGQLITAPAYMTGQIITIDGGWI